MKDRTAPLFAILALVLAACGGEENRPASWEYISPAIIQPNCATSSCHSKAAAVAGLDLSETGNGYRSLMGQSLPTRPDTDYKGNNPPRVLVVPGNPTQSRIVNMMRGIGANLMPPDRPLPEADIALIEEWILAGASND
ncbi:MAG TPA: hypothetical protein VGF45_23555 [Polyangia bacterium]